MKTIEDSTVSEIWEIIETQLATNKQPYEKLNAIFEFQILDSEEMVYQLHLHDGEAKIYESSEKEPDCSLKMKVAYFKKFLLGDLNSTTAFMTGKLKVNGNLGLALKLESMLKHYQFDQ